ncbi:hypothetical protein [Salinimonas chungwhensis]|uniref:hypothetical protein n=1 Tax=Salinimonas chungwhensis TaxID=265425 RepID=UPI00035FF226|nr:hypothetical protein [Salinimonas chungwhensis]
MNTFFLRALGGLLLLATAISVTANAEYFDNAQSTQIKTSQPLNKSDRGTLLTKILTVFAEHYMDESSIDKVTASVRTQHNAGRYDDI